MKRSSEFNSYNPLYLISSPIGNLSDITERQKEVLNTLDILYCEDTRVTKKLLEHLSIEKLSLDSYHDFSEDTKIDKIVSEIKSGLKVGLISDAGNPVISDPGYEVVRRLVSEDIRVIPVPGISAYTTALTISPLRSSPISSYSLKLKYMVSSYTLVSSLDRLTHLSPKILYISFRVFLILCGDS